MHCTSENFAGFTLHPSMYIWPLNFVLSQTFLSLTKIYRIQYEYLRYEIYIARSIIKTVFIIHLLGIADVGVSL
jgi:hypothetical protein